MTFLYWIRHQDHVDPKSQGYIGITESVKNRFRDHKNRTNEHLRNAFEKYKSEIVIDIILEDTRNRCLSQEQRLRPTKNIGWNIAVGGGNPPKTSGPRSEETRKKISTKAKERGKRPEWHKISMRVPKPNAKGKKKPPMTNETKERIALSKRGRVWWTDGKSERFASEPPDPSFVRGRL